MLFISPIRRFFEERNKKKELKNELRGKLHQKRLDHQCAIELFDKTFKDNISTIKSFGHSYDADDLERNVVWFAKNYRQIIFPRLTELIENDPDAAVVELNACDFQDISEATSKLLGYTCASTSVSSGR